MGVSFLKEGNEKAGNRGVGGREGETLVEEEGLGFAGEGDGLCGGGGVGLGLVLGL